MKELGLYIHIPFCVSKCYYCNFNSQAGQDNLKETYIKAIIKEIVAFSSNATDCVVSSIYIGGGTPSCMSEGCIRDVMNAIKSNYNLSNNAEISIEANPNSVTIEKAREWRECGINRVSVGLQSANDSLLKAINRAHTLEEYLSAIKVLKSVGFSNINTDIMLGLPNQTLKDVKDTLKVVLKNKIPHISAYSLILEEGTPLHTMVNSGKITLPGEDEVVKMYDYVYKTLKRHNINRYEVSNFAKKGLKCIHNYNCWNMVEYVGFGVGANSYFNRLRWGNIESIKAYIDNISSDLSVKDFEGKESNEDLYDEYIMLKLRTTEGVDLKKVKDEYYFDLLSLKKDEISRLLKYGLIDIKNNHLFATCDGFKVLNQIILELVY